MSPDEVAHTPYSTLTQLTESRADGVPQGLVPAPCEGMLRKQIASNRWARMCGVRSIPSPWSIMEYNGVRIIQCKCNQVYRINMCGVRSTPSPQSIMEYT